MFERFYPTKRVDSAYGIDYDAVYRAGIRGLIFDIDNTLVRDGAPADDTAKALFVRLKEMGFSTCLISNNKKPRVSPFAEAVGSAFVCEAHKPSTKEYLHAMEIMGTDVHSTLFIGDQLFTDVFGANRTGIPSLLVHPIHPKEEIQIVFKRFFEQFVLIAYERRERKRKREGEKC